MISHHKNSNNIIFILCLTVLALLLVPASAVSVPSKSTIRQQNTVQNVMLEMKHLNSNLVVRLLRSVTDAMGISFCLCEAAYNK